MFKPTSLRDIGVKNMNEPTQGQGSNLYHKLIL